MQFVERKMIQTIEKVLPPGAQVIFMFYHWVLGIIGLEYLELFALLGAHPGKPRIGNHQPTP